MPKRKHVVVMREKKVEIIEALKKGESGRSLSERYGVGTATISDIGKKAAAIMEYSKKLGEEGGSSQRKSMKGPGYQY
ncbi:CENP-B DNA-binding domain protein [Trichuris suis]|nr:CENP-B DNA-binding domain protein [Trichuris suis]